MDREVVEILSNFVFELIVDEELAMARLLRKKLLSKAEKRPQGEKNNGMKGIFDDFIDAGKFLQPSTASSKLLPYLNTFTK